MTENLIERIVDYLRRHRDTAHQQLVMAVLAGDTHTALRNAVVEEYTRHLFVTLQEWVRQEEGEHAARELKRIWGGDVVLLGVNEHERKPDGQEH